MTRLQHLTALRDKVKAGEFKTGPHSHAQKALGMEHTRLAHSAFNGSLDAAKALHDSMLPGWYAIVDTEGAAYVSDYAKKLNERQNSIASRAWLLAILEALIAQEGGE